MIRGGDWLKLKSTNTSLLNLHTPLEDRYHSSARTLTVSLQFIQNMTTSQLKSSI